jgi:hypothetical protein
MLSRDFKKFYRPYFYDTNLTITPVEHATLDQARTCEFLSMFDHSQVSELPLHELVIKHILDLPKGFTFISAGPDADPMDRGFRQLISTVRNDISYITPDREITAEWVEISATKYFSTHPFLTHTLKTMDRLVTAGIPCGRFGPFIRGSKLLGQWTVQEVYDTIPLYLYGLEHENLVVPNFVLPFSRALVKHIQLPNCIFNTSQIGPVILMMALTGDSTFAKSFITDGEDWNWYPNLINRNWQRPSYHSLERFL